MMLGSKVLVPNRNAKSDRSRRIWSVREEEILMATLKELTANGWKADNGFRTGYLVRGKEAIKSEFPKTDIQPHPHITRKRNHESLKMMLNHNGIGFNSDGTYRIECDDESWALFCKVCGLLFETMLQPDLHCNAVYCLVMLRLHGCLDMSYSMTLFITITKLVQFIYAGLIVDICVLNV